MSVLEAIKNQEWNMEKVIRVFSRKVVAQPARSRVPGCLLGFLLAGAVLFFTPPKTQAALFDLVLDPNGLGRTNVYDFYAWSPGSSWEVAQSVLAAKSYFNEVFTFDVTPNLIGMHLLDLEASNSYRYNLGYVLVATFGWADDNSNRPASGDVPGYQSDVLDSLKAGAIFVPPYIPDPSPDDESTDNPPNVPEPVTLVFLTMAASAVYWKRRQTAI
jgi:hypothetical protein